MTATDCGLRYGLRVIDPNAYSMMEYYCVVGTVYCVLVLGRPHDDDG